MSVIPAANGVQAGSALEIEEAKDLHGGEAAALLLPCGIGVGLADVSGVLQRDGGGIHDEQAASGAEVARGPYGGLTQLSEDAAQEPYGQPLSCIAEGLRVISRSLETLGRAERLDPSEGFATAAVWINDLKQEGPEGESRSEGSAATVGTGGGFEVEDRLGNAVGEKCHQMLDTSAIELGSDSCHLGEF
jgi:hypothetical protein